MNGKKKCKILKEIRAEIAKNNDIEYVTSECRHKGDCAGTCPKCEAELRYLERELEKRQRLGKAVVIAGLGASIALSAAGCVELQTTDGDMLPPETYEELMGDVPLPGVLPEETESEPVMVKGELIDPDLVEGELVAEDETIQEDAE